MLACTLHLHLMAGLLHTVISSSDVMSTLARLTPIPPLTSSLSLLLGPEPSTVLIDRGEHNLVNMHRSYFIPHHTCAAHSTISTKLLAGREGTFMAEGTYRASSAKRLLSH